MPSLARVTCLLSLALHVCLALPRPEAALAPVDASAAVAGDGDWFPEGELVETCKHGVASHGGDVCCPLSCKDRDSGESMCGGAKCSDRPGGPKHCCIKEIEETKVICHKSDDVICIMPSTCAEDRCLLHCPLNPACSIIWKNRGMDYLSMRQKLGFPISHNETDSRP